MSVPFVRIGSHHPLSRKGVCPPLEPKVEGQHTLAGEGTRGAKSDERRESLALCLLWACVYLRFNSFHCLNISRAQQQGHTQIPPLQQTCGVRSSREGQARPLAASLSVLLLSGYGTRASHPVSIGTKSLRKTVEYGAWERPQAILPAPGKILRPPNPKYSRRKSSEGSSK